jgi:ribosome-associated heat shock protein Hsp15
MPRQKITRTSEDKRPEGMRIDRWLHGVRLFKSRSAATGAVAGGRIHLNGERVKPAHVAKHGDTINFIRGGVSFECLLTAIPLRRGPATEALRCYEETAASKARREEFVVRMKMAGGPSSRAAERPDKRGRRLLRRLRGRDV